MQMLRLPVSSSFAFLRAGRFDGLLKTGRLIEEIVQFPEIRGALNLLSQSTALGGQTTRRGHRSTFPFDPVERGPRLLVGRWERSMIGIVVFIRFQLSLLVVKRIRLTRRNGQGFRSTLVVHCLGSLLL